jgi:uncharacterized protein YndB with AHSA1/START domain
MKQIAYETAATIVAPPERVWSVLTNGDSYAQWNPEIVGIEGRLALGERVTVRVRLGDGAIRSVPQRVVAFDPPNRMEWVGGLPLGMFVGRRTFTVTRVATGTEFRMHLHMSGPLASLILRSVGDRQPEIDRFSAALKARVESLSV